jgi:hypothetical protein
MPTDELDVLDEHFPEDGHAPERPAQAPERKLPETPPAPEPAPKPKEEKSMPKKIEKCGGSGCPPDQQTPGCKPCYQRAYRRGDAKRPAPAKPAPAAQKPAAPPAPPSQAAGGVTAEDLLHATDASLLALDDLVQAELQRRLESKSQIEARLRHPAA